MTTFTLAGAGRPLPYAAASRKPVAFSGAAGTPATTQQNITRLSRAKKAAVVHYSRFLALMAKGNWLYATRPNADGVVAVMTLVHAPDQSYLVFLKTKRPPMQGKTNMEPVAGLQGDEGTETGNAAALRELHEEIGLKLKDDPVTLFSEPVPSSPGMTDEATRYYFAEATLDDAQVKAVRKHKATGDGTIIRGQVWVPFDELIAKPVETLERYAREQGVPTKDMLSGLMLLLGHLRETGRLRLEWNA